jgi:hypothetical protein
MFKIPKIAPPSEDELIGLAENFMKNHEGICFSDWNEELLSRTFQIETAHIPKEVALKILRIADGSKYVNDAVESAYPIIKPLVDRVSPNGESFFIKLNTRSPKDVCIKFDDITEAICVLGGASMRTFDDMCILRYLDNVHVIVRPWVEYDLSKEFRVLIKDSKIMGISQYFYNENYNRDLKQLYLIEKEIREFVDYIIIPNMKVKTFVADIITHDYPRFPKPILLETNPYGLSDPCMFESYDNLDGSFRAT